jgi:anti-sigma B factor antagonist
MSGVLDDGALGRSGDLGDELAPGPMDRVRVRIDQTAGVVVVHVNGEVDVATAELVRVQVITAALSVTPPRLVLDMHGVTHCDSSGLSALVAIYRAIHVESGGLVVARPPAYCREILKRTGLDQRLAISDTLEQAVTQLAGSAFSEDGQPSG